MLEEASCSFEITQSTHVEPFNQLHKHACEGRKEARRRRRVNTYSDAQKGLREGALLLFNLVQFLSLLCEL